MNNLKDIVSFSFKNKISTIISYLMNFIEKTFIKSKNSLISFTKFVKNNVWEKVKITLGKLKNEIRSIYRPSISSSILILLGFILLIKIISYIDCFYLYLVNNAILEPLNPKYELYFNNLDYLSIHLGIGTIIFALFILIAESMRDEQFKDKARILLKVTYLWPLTVFEVLVLVSFLSPNTKFIFHVGLIICVAIFTLFAIARIILNLIDIDIYVENRIKFYEKIVLRSLSGSIEERNDISSFNLEFEKFKPQFNISFEPINKLDFHHIKSNKYGIIHSIDINKIEDLKELIENSQIKDTNISASSDITISTYQSSSVQIDPQIIFAKNIGQELNDEDNILVYIKQEIIDEEDLITTEKLIKNIFRIKNKTSDKVDLRLNFSSLREDMIFAIKSENSFLIRLTREIYSKITEIMIYEIGKYPKLTINDLEEIKWLIEDISYLYEKILSTDNIDLIKNMIYLPFKLTLIAKKAKVKELHEYFMQFNSKIENHADITQKDNVVNYLNEYHLKILQDIKYNYSEVIINE